MIQSSEKINNNYGSDLLTVSGGQFFFINDWQEIDIHILKFKNPNIMLVQVSMVDMLLYR